MKKIGEAIFKILTSRKGLSWIFYNTVLVVMAIKLKGDYPTFCMWFFAGLAAFGIGVEHDKHIEIKKAGSNILDDPK